MDRSELIKKYIDFFEEKRHKRIENFSLIPENDPTVLFTTAGMHPLVPFLIGQKHPLGKRLVGVQKCVRTGDIDEVGDAFHHTFFEMLGNWSLGDYFKEEAIKLTFEFHTKILKIPLERYAVTIFSGKGGLKKDEESKKIWLSLGIPKERIAELDDNWWGPAGSTGPCGPDTEMFYWTGKEEAPEKYDPEDERWVEIGNDVLMEFTKDKFGEISGSKQKNIDFGGGLERTLAVINGLEDNYLTDAWQPIIKKIEELSKKQYEENKRTMRIIADHIKASVFILNEGIIPGPAEQGYVLRRLIRRAIRFAKELNMTKFISKVAQAVFETYADYNFDKKKIIEELEKEEKKFSNTLSLGLKKFKKLTIHSKSLSGKNSFLLYQSFGFPLELIIEECEKEKIKFNPQDFESEMQLHQRLSKTASIGKFKSGLADNTKKTTQLHTATHILLATLKKILGEEVNQKGSNITSERLRFDFNFGRKLTPEEIRKIEEMVNKVIKKGYTVKREEMSLEKAKKQKATGVFDSKYARRVSVYTIGNKNETYSKEICAGPHVQNTKELGKFKIIKEESSSAGIRRIKAVLEEN